MFRVAATWGGRQVRGRKAQPPALPSSWAPTHCEVVRAQCLLPDPQGIEEKVCGFFVLVLVPVGQRRDGGGQPGWGSRDLAELGMGGTPSGSPHTSYV